MQNEIAFHLDDSLIREGRTIFRAINHPTRKGILELIHSNRQLIVTEIYRGLRIEQSVASQHLAILRKAGIVHAKRTGKRVYYSVAYERLREIHVISGKLLDQGGNKSDNC
jgi:DNA-binding transcriptional ArsR family regulator